MKRIFAAAAFAAVLARPNPFATAGVDHDPDVRTQRP